MTIAGIERDWPATVIYARHKGFAGDRTSPPEPATVEIIDIKLGEHGGQHDLPAEMVNRFCEDAELLDLLMDDWAADDAWAEECRAESRAELRREDAA